MDISKEYFNMRRKANETQNHKFEDGDWFATEDYNEGEYNVIGTTIYMPKRKKGSWG